MRPIDADRLNDVLIEKQYSAQTMGIMYTDYPQMMAIVSNQPTIDFDSLRPKGRWVDKWKWLYKNRLYKCSVCNETALGNDKTWFLTDFCPNCGADMREEREE